MHIYSDIEANKELAYQIAYELLTDPRTTYEGYIKEILTNAKDKDSSDSGPHQQG